jgi:hypothetical protein
MGQTLQRSNGYRSSDDTGVHSPADPRGTSMRPVKRRAWIGGLVVAAAVLIGGAFAITSTLMDDSATASSDITQTSTSSAVTPEPISRVELMEEYAKVAPDDATATPDAIDDVAEQACDKLIRGHSTDELITAVTDLYGANSTKVMRLLVSYGCPEYLEDFK